MTGRREGPVDEAGDNRVPGPIPDREPVHEVDRQRSQMERRLATGGFAILLGAGVLFLVARYGTLPAIVGAAVIVCGAMILAALWVILSAIEWWANRPSE